MSSVICSKCDNPIIIEHDEHAFEFGRCDKCGMEVVESHVAVHTQHQYVCAGCFGDLEEHWVDGPAHLSFIYCGKCGPGRGFVTRRYAEQRLAESNIEAAEVEHNIGHLIGIDKPKKTEEQILKELGF